MKRSIATFLALIITFAVAAPFSHAAGTARENQRLQQGKITKNQAEHLVLKAYPGARIKKCRLVPGTDHGIWMVELVKAGAHETSKLQVDGLSGKFLP